MPSRQSRRQKLWLRGVLTTLVITGAMKVAADEQLVDISEAALFPEPLSLAQLGSASGRQGLPLQLQLNESQQNAVLSDNLLSGNVQTGNNSISDNAFQHMSGIATVIQNTGNQVVIQDSTLINVLINH